ncbi:MAG: rhodanese-like domain-containing protein [Micromonosporaceae bacterium]|jgi:rhodanese-related sulfurtransferase|nr:rhodanese-like domain-containing protein [Micromonosporaceae bacterium]
MFQSISRSDLQAAINTRSVTIVDALPPRAYRRRHLPDAVNLAAEDIDRVAEVLPDKAAAIVVYSTDEACTRGPELAQLLESLGYRNIRIYAGGIEDWAGAGLPVSAAVG